jgi:DNA polymerase-3 subunit delta
MVALKSQQVDAFIAKPEAAMPIALVFGPDAGLVRERADALIRASVDDPNDPFALVKLDGDELASDPVRLVDEANTIPLFGGRRAVLVRAGSRNIAPAVEALIAAPADHCRVVIEAGDLKRNAPLRVVCERAKRVAAIACYPDTERDLARLIDQELRAAGLAIDADARAALVPLIGGDRQASLSEIRKLVLYAQGKDRVTLDDVFAVVSDASSLAADAVVDAAFAGRTSEVETQFAKARGAGTAAGTIISTALRYVMQLHRARLAVENGLSSDEAAEQVCGRNFRRKPLVESALKAWNASRLQSAMLDVAQTVLDTRRDFILAEPLARQRLLAIALRARQKK